MNERIDSLKSKNEAIPGPLSDRELVNLCLEGSRSAWNEFFTRFIPYIKRSIKSSLCRHGTYTLGQDIDVIAEVNEAIVVKLYAKGGLTRWEETSDIRHWLSTLCANQTIDWLKSQGRLKNLPRLQSEYLTSSLSEPLGGHDGFTLEETLADEWQDNSNAKHYVEQVLRELNGIDNIKQRWLLRLSILGQIPLSIEETDELCTISPLDQKSLKEELALLESRLDNKEQARTILLGKAVLCWHQMRRLEEKIKAFQAAEDSHGAVMTLLRQQLADKIHQREELLKRGARPSRPSNLELSRILGLSEERCEDISVYLRRAREALRSRLNATAQPALS